MKHLINNLYFYQKSSKMRYLLSILFLGFIVTISSCRKDFEFELSSGNLEFSRDTIYLDTVFSNIGSSTYTLKVYNKSKNDITIPSIALERNENSGYRMTVDGMIGENNKSFKNVELLAQDSLYIFIETTANIAQASAEDFLYTDKILFDSGSKQQVVNLVTLIQDAYFIFPNRENGIYESVDYGHDEDGNVTQIRGRNLQENHPDNGNELIWNNSKPYVIYGFASVPSGKTLEVQAGARIHFHADSGLIVQEDATLKVDGNISTDENQSNEVIFEGDRLEPFFADVPGQWGFVYLRQGSKNHDINYLTIKNATIGLFVENNFGNTMQIHNTQIYNSSYIGLLARHAKIDGFNFVVNNAGEAAVACTWGGSYNFTHCTFNNNWPSNRQVSLLVDNFIPSQNSDAIAFDLLQANFKNCIIYGNNQIEMQINKNDTKQFNYNFENCIIRFNNTSSQYRNHPEYQFDNPIFYLNNIIANNSFTVKPEFVDVNKNILAIKETSDAKGTANFSYSENTLDITGKPRMNPSDIGAYNFVLTEED